MKTSKIRKSTILATALTGLMFSVGSVQAGGNHCNITYKDKDGKIVGVIKERAGDCGTGSHGCAGQNPAKEVDGWFFMAEPQCKMIQDAVDKGDLSQLPTELKAKIADKFDPDLPFMDTLGTMMKDKMDK